MSLSVRLSIKPLGTSSTLLGVQFATPLFTPTVTEVLLCVTSSPIPHVRHCHSSCHSHIRRMCVTQLPIPPSNLHVLPHVTPTHCHSHTVPLTYLLTLTCFIAPISEVARLYVSLAYHKCHSYRFGHSHTEECQSCILSFPIEVSLLQVLTLPRSTYIL